MTGLERRGALKVPEGRFEVVPARNGYPTLQWIGAGRTLWVHSPHDPVEEGRRFARALADPGNPGKLVVVLGVGLGYHIQALCELPADSRFGHVLAAEPGGPITPVTGNGPDGLPKLLCPLVEKGLLTVVTTVRELKAAIVAILEHRLPGVRVAYHPVLRQVRPADFAEWEEAVRDALRLAMGNLVTHLSWNDTWIRNMLKNLPHLRHSSPVSAFFGAWKDRPAIVVSAGPSLSKQLDGLARAKGRALIIAVGTALKALIGKGIEPDLVVSIDGGEPNFRHFEGVRCGAPLIFDPMIYPAILDAYQGPKVAADAGSAGGEWLAAHGLQLGRLHAGGSVAHVALDFAMKAGANPIILIGQDLAFTDRRTHAAGTVYADRELKSLDGVMWVPGYFGGRVPTSSAWNNFRLWFEQYLSVLPPGRMVINATEGGARINGTLQMSFAEALTAYCGQDQPVEELIQLATATTLDCSELDSWLEAARREVAELAVLASEAAAECRTVLRRLAAGRGNPPDVMKRVRRLVAFDHAVLSLRDALLLLSDGAYRSWLRVMATRAGSPGGQASGIDGDEVTWRRSYALYSDLHALCQRLIPALDEALERLRTSSECTVVGAEVGRA